MFCPHFVSFQVTEGVNFRSKGSEFQTFAPRKANDLWPVESRQCGKLRSLLSTDLSCLLWTCDHIQICLSNKWAPDGVSIYAPWRLYLMAVILLLQSSSILSKPGDLRSWEMRRNFFKPSTIFPAISVIDKLVRSRWLDVGLVLFFACFSISSHLDFTLVGQ